MARLSNLYLFFYNSVQAFGWVIALFKILTDFISTKSVNGAYASAGDLIFYGRHNCGDTSNVSAAIPIFRIPEEFRIVNGIRRGLLQTLGFIEVLHGALGIVPSGFLFPLMQWGGRTHFLLAIVRRLLEVQESPAVFITFVAWCCMEIIRYPFYALSCLGNCPSFITYLRYTAFIVIYPIGVLGEMWIMYKSLPVITEKNLYADYFSALPFSYYAFVKAVLICYPFLWLQLYLYLFKQRRSKLRPRNEKAKKKN